jgi:hypothetical protein
MSKPDDDLQNILFGEVKEMDVSLEDICIDLNKKTIQQLQMMSKKLNKIKIKFIMEVKQINFIMRCRIFLC